eukprot:TRINITY_DN136855_c0_g1_i1.p1 TRINITY_DN136855_c0_g1~~TRINITY_DN136855_c0_g1_i1.p1  ORF type:complete len:262 (-),score=49.47 TRINITY_DN136855_c0_g1_i1:99-884(-)
MRYDNIVIRNCHSVEEIFTYIGKTGVNTFFEPISETFKDIDFALYIPSEERLTFFQVTTRIRDHYHSCGSFFKSYKEKIEKELNIIEPKFVFWGCDKSEHLIPKDFIEEAINRKKKDLKENEKQLKMIEAKEKKEEEEKKVKAEEEEEEEKKNNIKNKKKESKSESKKQSKKKSKEDIKKKITKLKNVIYTLENGAFIAYANDQDAHLFSIINWTECKEKVKANKGNQHYYINPTYLTAKYVTILVYQHIKEKVLYVQSNT